MLSRVTRHPLYQTIIQRSYQGSSRVDEEEQDLQERVLLVEREKLIRVMAVSDKSSGPTAKAENYGSARLYDRMPCTQPRSEVQSVSILQGLGPHGMPIYDYPLAEILPASGTNQLEEYVLPTPTTSSWPKPLVQIRSPLASALIARSSSSKDVPVPILPCIFAPFAHHLTTPDLAYLHQHDALTLPNESVQIELLKAYVEFVHSSMPLLDLEHFLSAVKYGSEGLGGQNEKRNGWETAETAEISFLLFQAVMFSAVGFVSMRVLQKAGHSSRESAKRAFFNRVRYLYDFDVCTDRLSIIQSLLLMTLWPANMSSKGDKDAWHWLGLAISHSYSLGLNRKIPCTTDDLRIRRLKRRVWWATFVRDRTLALSDSGTFKRVIRIKREDCDVEMLSMDDFDLNANEEVDAGKEATQAMKNAALCVERALLCWCSNDGLLEQ
ncbi:hypothetical protein OIDMADRAFT_36477 [Oidiodendron maius Zn]|uniref:Xylanolytic transcriptional activator regulatory domain-containing protein n=1 Tax=Oidiodendron maius (strain Zn) TaxID=913774 RepID=A0A0C3GQ34_OIDMZ|nr:hypothetical protein OIDMADRAFT_36477 [Oidiodendron maius Zn]